MFLNHRSADGAAQMPAANGVARPAYLGERQIYSPGRPYPEAFQQRQHRRTIERDWHAARRWRCVRAACSGVRIDRPADGIRGEGMVKRGAGGVQR